MKNKKYEKYYEENYDLVYDVMQTEVKGGLECFDVLKNAKIGRKVYFKDSNKRCRFCGKSGPDVTFKEVAHSYPEFLGNKCFINKNFECDSCNKKIGNHFEPELRKIIMPFLVMQGVTGKKGKPTYRSINKKTEITNENGHILIKKSVDSNDVEIDLNNNELKLKLDGENSFSQLSAYKALLKMALSTIKEDEISNFRIAFKRLNKDDALNDKIFLRALYSGFNNFSFEVLLYKRKDSIKDVSIPYYQFAIRNGNFMFQLPIYSDNDYLKLSGKKVTLNFIPIPSDSDCLNLQENSAVYTFVKVNEVYSENNKYSFISSNMKIKSVK